MCCLVIIFGIVVWRATHTFLVTVDHQRKKKELNWSFFIYVFSTNPRNSQPLKNNSFDNFENICLEIMIWWVITDDKIFWGLKNNQLKIRIKNKNFSFLIMKIGSEKHLKIKNIYNLKRHLENNYSWKHFPSHFLTMFWADI